MPKYIRFEKEPEPWEGLPHWIVVNKRSHAPLAQVFWYPPWKCYVVEFKEKCVFNEECLNDIKTFITDATLTKGRPVNG